MIMTMKSKKCSLKDFVFNKKIRQASVNFPVQNEPGKTMYEEYSAVKVYCEDDIVSIYVIYQAKFNLVFSLSMKYKLILGTRNYPRGEIDSLQDIFKDYYIFLDEDITKIVIANVNERGRRLLNRSLSKLFLNEECVNDYRCTMKNSSVHEDLVEEVALSRIPRGYILIHNSSDYEDITTFDPTNHNFLFEFIMNENYIVKYIEDYISDILEENITDGCLSGFACEFAKCIKRKRLITMPSHEDAEKIKIYRALQAAGRTVNVLIHKRSEFTKCFSASSYHKIQSLHGYEMYTLKDVEQITFGRKTLYQRA